MVACLGVSPALLSTASRWKSPELPSATAIFLPLSCATEVIDEPSGTRRAAASGFPRSAPTIAIWSPEAAAKTGGASPTPPMSSEPLEMACRIGGPDGKSDQATLNGSLLISPAAMSSALAPVPAWSPMRRVTFASCAALTVSLLLDAVLLDDPDEQAAASRPAARKQAATRAERKRAGRLIVISFLPW